MGPIVINVDPVIVSIGHFSLRWYGLGIGLAIAAGLFVAVHEAKRKGIAEDEIYSFAMWAVLAGLIGARLFHVIDNWSYYLANPGAILAFQNGGLAIFGGIIGGVVGGLLYIKRRGLPLGRIADLTAPAVVLGQAIGRIGCIINGDAVGVPTDLPWGFVYTNPGAMAPSLGTAYQPTQAYEMLWDLSIFAFLWWARKRLRPDGLLFLIYLSLYAVGKFIVSFLRQEVILFMGLQEAQILGVIVLAVTLPLIWRLLHGHLVTAVRQEI